MRGDHVPYLIAASYSLAVSALVVWLLKPPPPRFMDVYLIGIIYVTLRWSWRPAVLIFLISQAVAAWILPPLASLAVSGGADVYRMFSYSITTAVTIWAIEVAKRQYPPKK